MTPTHIIKRNDSNNCEWLFRAPDGMAIAKQQDITVIFGEDPNKAVGRVFIDAEHARQFLRKKADEDAGSEGALILFVNDEELIIKPGDVMVMPGSGSLSRLKN